ncbi:MAG: MjaI family restriction endonuclease [Marinilabiliaceae bacterium]
MAKQSKLRISNNEIAHLSNASEYEFPKYATQILNLVNGNAQGTIPHVVGQMSDLIQEFEGKSLQDWIEWYSRKRPDAIRVATDKIYAKFLEMRKAAESIDRNMIEDRVKDLVYNKTYCGPKFQGAIIAFLAKRIEKPWRLANKDEENDGMRRFHRGDSRSGEAFLI